MSWTEENINEILNEAAHISNLINDKIINHITTLRDLMLVSSALNSRKLAKLKTKILLEMVNEIIIEYSNISEFIQWKLIKKCDIEEISLDDVSFLVSLEAKHFYKPSMLHIKVSVCY